MCIQAVVGGLAEQEVYALHDGVLKELLLLIRVSRPHEHVERERLAGERAGDLRHGVGVHRAVEVDSRSGGDAGLVGYTLELEVVVLVEVVTCYRLAEPQLEVIAYAEDGIGRLRFAEQYRRTGVFHAADDGRSLGNKARTVAAERYCAQVILLLHRIALAVEAERSDLAVLDHRLVARSQVVQAVVGVERALVHPHLVTFLA